MPMPDDVVHLLAKSLLDRDEPVLGANGALPAVQVFCEDMAAATGKTARVGQHTRLFELGDLVEPRPVPGRLRPATLEERDLVASWYDAFMADADEQAGREPGESPHELPTDEELGRRIETGRIFVWVDQDDLPVNVTAANQHGTPSGHAIPASRWIAIRSATPARTVLSTGCSASTSPATSRNATGSSKKRSSMRRR